jgi:hypothetical protein
LDVCRYGFAVRGCALSQTAGQIVQDGAHQLASTQPTAGIFGDFDAATAFIVLSVAPTKAT